MFRWLNKKYHKTRFLNINDINSFFGFTTYLNIGHNKALVLTNSDWFHEGDFVLYTIRTDDICSWPYKNENFLTNDITKINEQDLESYTRILVNSLLDKLKDILNKTS
jgi:hypothetical protein